MDAPGLLLGGSAWDHAAGLLLVDGGGRRAPDAPSGEPFRITGGNALPFTVGRDEATARTGPRSCCAGGGLTA